MAEMIRRLTAAFLLLTGVAVWAFSTWAGAGVLAAEQDKMWGDSRHNESIDPGDGQLATALFDVQVGALLVFGCAVAALLCRSMRRLGDVLAVLIALPCVLFVVNAILARVVGSSLTAAVTGGLVLAAACVAFARVARSRLPPSPDQQFEPPAGRLLLLALAVSAAGAVPVLENLQPANWIVAALPGLVSISVVQGALIAAMLALIALMVVRWTAVTVAAAAVITVVGGWLVLGAISTRGDGPWTLPALGAVLVAAAATAAVIGSADPRPRPSTGLMAVAATTAAYCVAQVPAFFIGMPVGITVQALSGGELGADGLPLLLGGVLAGLSGLAGYAAVLMRPSHPVVNELPTTPNPDQLSQRR